MAFPSQSRGRTFGATIAACLALGVAFFATLAYAAETQIFDPKTRKWVQYDRKKARSYYAAHQQVPEAFRRQIVKFRTAEKPGTIIIDGNQHFLYLVQPGFTAIRYGIGVGREGFGWAGIVKVGRTAEWPTWTPPAEMVARDPNARKWAGGQPGGPDNPLGARALYLYQGDQDTIYRIHGTPEPWTIGLDAGCLALQRSLTANVQCLRHGFVFPSCAEQRGDACGASGRDAGRRLRIGQRTCTGHGAQYRPDGSGRSPTDLCVAAATPLDVDSAAVLPVSSSQIDAQTFQVVLESGGARANCVVDTSGNVISVQRV
jgi:lipoprotein-anchoring transpeptidase ErfK/SrfK